MVAGMEATHGSRSMDAHLPRLAQLLQLPPVSLPATISQEIPLTVWWQVVHWISTRKGQQLILTEINTYRCGFAFLAYMISASTTF